MWLVYLRTIILSLRSIVFEQYTLVISILWFGSFFLFFLLSIGIHWSLGIILLLLAFFAYRNYVLIMLKQKYRLIRIGDYVEYSPLDTNEDPLKSDLYERAKIVRPMQQDEVALSGGFTKKYLEYYEQYYLCEYKEKNIFIPFEWILSIETELEYS